MENKDANCRLRHGLNIHCLAHIFQYLDSVDLYWLGKMNEFYMQIIIDFIIHKHTVNFDQLLGQKITIQQVFEKYGKHIKRFCITNLNGENTTGNFLQMITQYCSVNQIKCAKIYCRKQLHHIQHHIYLPIQFQCIEHLELQEYFITNEELPESIRSLKLSNVHLLTCMNNLKNLKELYLENVTGINVAKFIEFLGDRPSIEVFHHDRYTFRRSTAIVCEALANYCGEKIHDYSGSMTPPLYGFLSGFKNAKRICLTTYQRDCGDLIDAMTQLAENDTIEMLHINHVYDMRFIRNRNINRVPAEKWFRNMKHFTHLKQITIAGYRPGESKTKKKLHCSLELLIVFGSQILSNVERLTIGYAARSWDFINFMRKLRHLHLDMVDNFGCEEAAKIIPILVDILRKRNQERITSNSIEIKFNREYHRDIFEKGICQIKNGSGVKILYPLNGNYNLTIYHVNELCLMARHICGSDLINDIKKLTEIDTIEMLCINYLGHDWLNMPNVDCIFQDRSHVDDVDMKFFSNLKTIKISGSHKELDIYCHGNDCYPFKLLTVYGSQILSMVKQLIIDYPIGNWNMIKWAPKLRYLDFTMKVEFDVEQVTQVISNLVNILCIRNNEQSTRGDFIEIKCATKDILEMFTQKIMKWNKMNLSDTILYASTEDYTLTIYHNF